MATNVYVLKLEGGRYYVGKAQDPMRRYQEHLDGDGSAWTRRFPPVSLVETRMGVSPFEEDKATKEYMAIHGIDKVRGGSYVTEELSTTQWEECRTALRAAGDCCTRCGRKGHFVATCYASTHVEGDAIEEAEEAEEAEDSEEEAEDSEAEDSEAEEEEVWECDTCDREFESEAECVRHERKCSRSAMSSRCYRCGRTGHYADSCYAGPTLRNKSLELESESESESKYINYSD